MGWWRDIYLFDTVQNAIIIMQLGGIRKSSLSLLAAIPAYDSLDKGKYHGQPVFRIKKNITYS